MELLKQFFDKRMLPVFGGLLGIHILAFFLQHSAFNAIPLAFAFVAVLVLSYRSLPLGLMVAFLEVFVGGHGHLMDVDVLGFSLSIRMVLFAAVMLAYGALLVTRKVRPSFVLSRDLPWLLLFLAIALGGVVGLLTNAKGPAFDDFNSYLSVLYFFPVISVSWSSENRRLLLLTLSTAAVWVSLSTLVTLFAFTHLPGDILRELYVFLRDARLAEITILTAPDLLTAFFPTGAWYFRIFEQSQFVVLAFELLFAAGTLMYAGREKLPWQVYAVHALMLGTLFASMSRSFYLAMFVSAIVLLIGTLYAKVPLKMIAIRSILIGFTKVFAILCLWLLVIFPIPFRPDFTETPFYKGGDGADRDVAVSSRWNLLPPMMAEIFASPIIGSGFGEEVTFVTNDPRIRAINPSGEYTTYRFEWGYQDLWLKMGILGLLGFIAYAASIAYAVKNNFSWISFGLATGVFALFVTHVFSPYLNHPIGLTFMVFVLPFLAWPMMNKQKTEHVARSAEGVGITGSVSVGTP